MNKVESIIVGLFLGTACPLLTFVLFWWTSAVIQRQLPGISVNVVIAAALGGLAIGVILDILFLGRWVRKFYAANVWLLALVYLGLATIAVAFFMGLPLGTFALGIAVGVYAGRRQRHRAPEASPDRAVRTAALFSAIVTTAAAAPIGIFALEEQSVVGFLGAMLGVEEASIRGAVGLTIVGVLCAILFVAQYWCTKQAGMVAFRLGGDDARQKLAERAAQ